jgi:hypothetical protein
MLGKFHCGKARNVARGLVYRVLAQMGMGSVCCSPVRGTTQNQEAALRRANLKTGGLTDDSDIDGTKLRFYCANPFAAALFVRDKCKSD